MFALTIRIIRQRALPTARSFAISFVFEVYVSSFLAIERPRDRISPILWKLRSLFFQKPVVRREFEESIHKNHLFLFCASFRDV
jgi:hypothetical protein